MLSEKQTETYFKQAVEELYKNDGYLFDPDHGLHEQTVSHRLAVYLERRFLKNKTFTANTTETGTTAKSSTVPVWIAVNHAA